MLKTISWILVLSPRLLLHLQDVSPHVFFVCLLNPHPLYKLVDVDLFDLLGFGFSFVLRQFYHVVSVLKCDWLVKCTNLGLQITVCMSNSGALLLRNISWWFGILASAGCTWISPFVREGLSASEGGQTCHDTIFPIPSRFFHLSIDRHPSVLG